MINDISNIRILSPRNDIEAYRDKLTEQAFQTLSNIIDQRIKKELELKLNKENCNE